MSQQLKSASTLQSLPVKSTVVQWLPSSDLRQLSVVSKSLSQAPKRQLRLRRQQQYRQISSTLGDELSKLNISTNLAPEIYNTPMLPITLFTSVSDARNKLFPEWKFKKDRLVYSKRFNKLIWLLSGKPFILHNRYLLQIRQKIRSK